MPREVALNSRITVGNYVFRNRVSSLNIKSTWKSIYDSCVIELPNIRKVLDTSIKVGDAVRVELGYDGNYVNEFVGYVSAFSPTHPIKLHCKNEMWQLMQKSVNGGKGKVFVNSTIKDIITYLAPDAEFNGNSEKLSKFIIQPSVRNIAEAIQKVCDMVGLCAYYNIPEGEAKAQLYIGLPYVRDGFKEVNYNFQKNCVLGVRDELTFHKKEDFNVKVVYKSRDSKGKIKEVVRGDNDGDTITMNYGFELTDEQMTTNADDILKRYQFDGYRGKFKAFGIPVVRHSDTVNLYDEKFPERKGSFLVDATEVDYNENVGLQRLITLGPTVSTYGR